MSLSSDQPLPVLVHQGDANWWGIVDTDIQTPIAGESRVTVTLQTRKLDVDRVTQLWVGPPQTISYGGDRLTAAMADAMTRAATYLAGGAPADNAIYLGIRDALYAALKVDGYIPSEAK